MDWEEKMPWKWKKFQSGSTKGGEASGVESNGYTKGEEVLGAHVHFRKPIIWWHMAIKAHLVFNLKILINEISIILFMANKMLTQVA